MAEIQPPVSQINGGGGGGQLVMGSSETVGSKRQRRPSVRLGEIGGDQLYDSQFRRATAAAAKQWKLPPDLHHRREGIKSSKTRPLTNLNHAGGEFHETLDAGGEDREGNVDCVAIGSWKVRDTKKRASNVTKKVRSNWVSTKIDEGGGGDGGGGGVEGEEKFSGGEDVDDGCHRDFDVENSESPLKGHSPIHSSENLMSPVRRPIRARVSEGRDHHDGIELSGPSDNDARDWNCRGTSGDRNGGRLGGEDGVRVWLNGLGLGRYAPVFEIHEVDDEVLPMLTLEDLKDMGINAVGSRRKMYCAIQKLGKGFS